MLRIIDFMSILDFQILKFMDGYPKDLGAAHAILVLTIGRTAQPRRTWAIRHPLTRGLFQPPACLHKIDTLRVNDSIQRLPVPFRADDEHKTSKEEDLPELQGDICEGAAFEQHSADNAQEVG